MLSLHSLLHLQIKTLHQTFIFLRIIMAGGFNSKIFKFWRNFFKRKLQHTSLFFRRNFGKIETSEAGKGQKGGFKISAV